MCLYFCLFVFFYSFYDYYLFTCFSMAINYFCDLNSALSLSVQNIRIRKTPFLLWAGHVTPCHNWIDKDEFTPWVILYQYNFSKWSTQYIPRSIWYTFVFGHLPISVTVLSNFHFPLSPWQLQKVSKNNNGKLFSCK